MQATCEPLTAVFLRLTDKQQETIELLAEGRTGKEIATTLGISESAATQRIETLRHKCGGLLRKDLAREWRAFCSAQEGQQQGQQDAGATCNEFAGKSFHLQSVHEFSEKPPRDCPESELILSDAMPFEIEAPWDRKREERVVPEVLDGDNAALYRWFMAIGLALGMAVLCLVLLAVSSELADLV